MRPRRIGTLFCVCFAVALAISVAVPRAARADDFGVWASQWLWVDFKKPGKTHGWQLWFDLHERAWGTAYQAIMRPGVGYEIGRGVSLWAGYAFIPSLTAGTADSLRFEHRSWEQLIYNGRLKTVALHGRARLEQRFRQDSDGVGHRLRLLARTGFFFGADSKWGWAVWDELLVNLNTTSLWMGGFDQNRAFTGPFVQHKGVRVEFGYMNLLVNRKDVGLQSSHIAMVNLLFLMSPLREATTTPPPPLPPEPPPPPPPQEPEEMPPPLEQLPEPRFDSGLKSFGP